MTRSRILIVDDHEVVRIGLVALLGRQLHMEVVGEASDAEEAIARTTMLQPDIVLMDIRLPGRSGIAACSEILKVSPLTKVIMLTSFAEDDLLFDAIAAGAVGYVLKRVGSGYLIQAIEAARRGESLLDPTLAPRLLYRLRKSMERERSAAIDKLTDQEVRVLTLLTTGLSNKEMGHQLGLGEKTVRNYVSNILGKLNMVSRTEAAAFAVRHGLIDEA